VGDLAVVGNEYVQREKPWESHKPEAIASAYALVKALSVLLEPFVPSFSQRAYRVLALEGPTLADALRFEPQEVPLGEPEPLLQKIDIEAVQETYARLREQKGP
jgi:methionyl-tRNA synthetase